MDLDVGDITVTLPDPKSNRWMASQVLNQDHMTHPDLLKTGPAQFTITKEMMRTRYVIVIIRTEVFDGSDPNDIQQIHRLQVKLQAPSEHHFFFRTQLHYHITLKAVLTVFQIGTRHHMRKHVMLFKLLLIHGRILTVSML